MARQTTMGAIRSKEAKHSSATSAPKNSDHEADNTKPDGRRESIATAAYYRAERRNFEGNAELDDWLEAEREIDSAAAAGGIQSEASRLAEGPGDVSVPAMGDAANKADDPDYIDPSDVHQWAEKLGVSPSALRLAIERAGPRVPDVKRFLDQHEQGQR